MVNWEDKNENKEELNYIVILKNTITIKLSHFFKVMWNINSSKTKIFFNEENYLIYWIKEEKKSKWSMMIF